MRLFDLLEKLKRDATLRTGQKFVLGAGPIVRLLDQLQCVNVQCAPSTSLMVVLIAPKTVHRSTTNCR